MLWFAKKFVPLQGQQQQKGASKIWQLCCDLLKNLYLYRVNNNSDNLHPNQSRLWFAKKFVPLQGQQQRIVGSILEVSSCDLLKNLYLYRVNNNQIEFYKMLAQLWFAKKFVPLQGQQQQVRNLSYAHAVVIC